MAESLKDKLNKLKEQKEKLKAKIQRMESSQKAMEKKRDTRRKILVGSYILKKADNENSFEELKKDLDTFLTRDADRLLFDLEPNNEESTQEKQKKVSE